MSFGRAKNYLGLDYGGKRIGVATADSEVKIAIPYGVIINDEQKFEQVVRLINELKIDRVIVGYPRNQSGEATKQTDEVEAFVRQLKELYPKVVFQDESLTSVLAEERLQAYRKNYSREDIDAGAAAIILEDYLEVI